MPDEHYTQSVHDPGLERLVDSAEPEAENFVGVTVELAPIAPDYAAVHLTIIDSAWWQQSLLRNVTCWFSTVQIVAAPVSTADLRECVRVHRRMAAGVRRQN